MFSNTSSAIDVSTSFNNADLVLNENSLAGIGLFAESISAGIDSLLPEGFYRIKCRPLEFIGRHSLLIYAVHQPIFLLILEIVM